jgi:hypothetical protein
MIRGTTPTFTLKLREDCNVNLQEANNIYFTVSQGTKEITKTGADLEIADGKTILVFLNQEESLSLREGQKTEVQLNWTYLDPDGNVRRAATKIREIELGKQLIRRVIE